MKAPKLKDLKTDEKETQRIHQHFKKNSKVKITINIDQDTLLQIRQKSEKTGVPYQTLLNQILKKSLNNLHSDGSSASFESRLLRLEKEILKLKKKLAA